MRRLSLLLAGIVLLVTGCQQSCKVNIEGGGSFPKELVGTWKTAKGDWTIVFARDGQISSAVIPLGNITMKPGEVNRFETRFGGQGIFEPGVWTVTYTPEGRELVVEIVIEHFLQDVGNHSMEGNQTDILMGSVSEDWSQWEVDWFSMGKLEALIYEGWTLVDRKEIINSAEPISRGGTVLIKQEPDSN